MVNRGKSYSRKNDLDDDLCEREARARTGIMVDRHRLAARRGARDWCCRTSGALGLLRNRIRRTARVGLFFLAIAVTPAHIHMLQQPDLFSVPYWMLVLGLLLQAALQRPDRVEHRRIKCPGADCLGTSHWENNIRETDSGQICVPMTPG